MMASEVSKEIDELLKEREKFATFIKRLESERTSSSERAYSKVLADYEKRLEETVQALQGHSDSLRARLQEMQSSLQGLERERDARQEELEEARLRRSVGEYRDDQEWTVLERSLLDSVQEAESELEDVRNEIGHLNSIIAQVEGTEVPTPEPAASASSPQAQPTPPPSQPPPEPQAEPAPTSQPRPEPAQPSPGSGDDDFISLGELVLDDEDAGQDQFEPATVNPPPANEGVTEQPPSGGEVSDELAFLESLSLSNDAEDKGGGGDQETTFSFLEQHGKGTPQTIICPHCSAANDPAEWYCTECGEELPAE